MLLDKEHKQFFLPLHCIVVLVKCCAMEIYGQRLSILLRNMLTNMSTEYSVTHKKSDSVISLDTAAALQRAHRLLSRLCSPSVA